MFTKDDINKELETIAPEIIRAGNAMPHQVPANYFEQLPVLMLTRVGAMAPHRVPEGYFESLAPALLHKIQENELQEELHALAPILQQVSKTMPFATPAGYFDRLQPEQITQNKSKVVRLPVTFRWQTWAAAAAIICSIGIGWWLLQQPALQATGNAVAQTKSDYSDTLFTDIDTDAMEAYLHASDNATEFTMLLMAAEEGVESRLPAISTTDISRYLDTHPEIAAGGS